SLNMGSMNFGLYEMIGRYKEFKHDWEKPYLAASDDRIFKNTFKDIAYILESCRDNDTRFEIECYDIGHLYTAAHFLDRKLLKPPLFIQSVFGIRGGIGPHPEDVLHMKRTADRLFGDAYLWSVLGAGVADEGRQVRLAVSARRLGRSARAHSCGEAHRLAQAAVHRREPHRRLRHHRHRLRREERAGWVHVRLHLRYPLRAPGAQP